MTQEKLPIWKRQHYGALPLILTDTSALLELGKVECIQEAQFGSSEARANITNAVISDLLEDDARTLVLTRRNFIEMMPTISGSLDLMKDDDGTIMIPDGVSHNEFRFPDAHILYRVLQRFQQEGKLRCYGSSEAFFEAGEVGRPKGGIVIVDVNARGQYPQNGRLNNFKAHPDAVIDAKSAEQLAAQYPDSGDDRLHTLSEQILNYATEHGLSRKFMVLNNDSGLKDRLEAQAAHIMGGSRGAQPAHARMLDLVAGMYQGNAEHVPGCNLTQEELVRFVRASTIERENDGRRMPHPNAIKRAAEYVVQWLDTTARTPDNWVERTADRGGQAIG